MPKEQLVVYMVFSKIWTASSKVKSCKLYADLTVMTFEICEKHVFSFVNEIAVPESR